MNKSFIEFVEKNSLYYFNEKENAFWIVTDIIHDAHDPMSGTSVQVATFLDLEGYYRQWAEEQGYYLMIDLCNKGKGIVEFYADLYWMAKDGLLDDDNDDKRLETKGMFKSREEAFMAALNKVMELV